MNQKTTKNYNNSTDNDKNDASRRKHQRNCIIPTETKVTCQQMTDLNQDMQYVTVLDKYWPTDLEHITILDVKYISITGIMVQMKDILRSLELDKAESNNVVKHMSSNKQIKCNHCLIDIDLFWRFQKTSTQRIMISLPSETYFAYQETKSKKLGMFQQAKGTCS